MTLVTPPSIKRERKPGEPPLRKIGVYDHKGNLVGHVGYKATEVTAARFLGRRGAELKTKAGRPAWVGKKPPPPPPVIVQGAPPATRLDKSLAADKGSVTDKPDKPKTHARPRS